MEKVLVDSESLRKLLTALNGPSYYIAELQAIRGIQGDENPINRLISDYNKAVEADCQASSPQPSHNVAET